MKGPTFNAGSRSAMSDVHTASPPGMPSRAGRSLGRVILIGHVDFTARVSQAIELSGIRADIEAVGSYIMALGEAGGRRPDVVIGDVELLGDLGPSFSSAMLRLAPRVKLIVMGARDDHEHVEQAVRDGFHAAIFEPFNVESILVAGTDPDIGSEVSPSDDEDSVGDFEQALLQRERPIRTPPTEVKVAAATLDAGESDAHLGDVDLVDHLMRSNDPLTPLAVRLIRARGGPAEIRWSPNDNLVPAGESVAPVRAGGRQFGVLHAPTPVTAIDLTPWAGWLGHWLALEDRLRMLHRAAMTDPLTGVWNRRYFDEFLEQLLARATAERFRVTLLMFDIDDFKLYNDRYGHAAGDEILVETARLLRTVVRDHDVVARIGGDEFVVIFWDADEPRRANSRHPTDVRRAAARFQRAIADHRFQKLKDAPGGLTISGGIAGFPWDGRTPAELLERADQMAIQAKREGKNAITVGSASVSDTF